MGRKKKELLPVKKKPRGRPFEKGNTVSRDSAIKRAKKRLVSVKLIEFKNAIELIANEGMSVKDACEKANILERVFYDIKNATPETKRVYYEALKFIQYNFLYLLFLTRTECHHKCCNEHYA